MQPWSTVRARLAAGGLNAVGVAEGAAYGAWLSGCRSVVVFGSGGRALWPAFSAAVEADPRLLSEQAHPLDAHVRRLVQGADAPHPDRRWAFADGQQHPAVPVQALAEAAGLGWSSRLGLVLHPTLGPWLGLRAVCFTRETLPVTGPLSGPGPCAACPAPCTAACPAGALAEGSLDWRACLRHRRDAEGCPTRCDARAACPEGADHRYTAEQHHFHHSKASGRAAFAQAHGLADPAPPPPPDWSAWLDGGA